MVKLIQAGWLLLGVLAQACTGPGGPWWSEQESSIINGSPDENPDHAAVVALVCGARFCSGTLVGGRVVLTAAHCVEGAAPVACEVYFGADMSDMEARAVSEIYPHPDYDGGAYDLALMRLSGDPPAGIVPLPRLPPEAGIMTADLGKPVEYVGFGDTETGDYGVRLTVSNHLDCFCPLEGNCRGSCEYNYTRASISTDLDPGGPGSGDSGGPVFIRRSGTEYVAGVTSYTDLEGNTVCVSTKVDEFRDFIDSFSGADLGEPCDRDGDCRSVHCVDGVCCESGCPGICMGCNLPGSAGVCAPLPDGTSCADDNMCNGAEVCLDGHCQPGEQLSCRDQLACTHDSCDPRRGCVFEPKAFECDDGEVCTRDFCDPQEGCCHQPLTDGTACGKCRLCESGACVEDASCGDPGGGCTAASGSAGGNRGAFLLLLLASLAARRRVVLR